MITVTGPINWLVVEATRRGFIIFTLTVFSAVIALACGTTTIQEQRAVPIKEIPLVETNVDSDYVLCQLGTMKQIYIDGPRQMSPGTPLGMKEFLALNPHVLIISTIKVGGYNHWPEMIVTYCLPIIGNGYTK